MFKRMQAMQCESVHCFSTSVNDKPLRAFIVLHNTDRGPALGGCRLQPYSSEQDALTDAMRLAQGMSYKAALADIPYGGGKAVIMEPDGDYDRRALFAWFADCVAALAGRYITAMDAGTRVDDMDLIASHTPFVASHSAIGDPSPYTALGVFNGIRAALEFQLNQPIKGSSVAIQGMGHVGLELARLLLQQGAKVYATDTCVQACDQAQELGAEVVSPEQIFQLPVDVLSPCALGAILNKKTIDQLNCRIIAGCANNQLQSAEIGDQLAARGILYAPDFVINSGGLIYAAGHYAGWDKAQIEQHSQQIYHNLLRLFRAAQGEAGVHSIAEQQARQILKQDQLKLSA